MTDQTESASEEPLTPAECVEYLDDIVANNAAGARNLAIPIELLSDSAAALRALEASRDLITHERNDLLLRLDADGIRDMEAELAYIRADRDRLAGEVERLTAACLALHAKRSQDVDERNAEVARLTAELAAARGDVDSLRAAALEAISAFRTLGKAHVSLYTLREMGRLAKVAHIAWCPWHGVDWSPSSIGCPKCHDEVDAARRAGGEG